MEDNYILYLQLNINDYKSIGTGWLTKIKLTHNADLSLSLEIEREERQNSLFYCTWGTLFGSQISKYQTHLHKPIEWSVLTR